MAFIAPGGSRWVGIEILPPDAAQDQLLPTQRLSLRSRWSRSGRVLLEGLETLCATHVQWQDESHLRLRLPLERAWALRVKDGEVWEGVSVQVALHEEQVLRDLWNEPRDRRLVVIQDCETGNWNLYLRRPGEPYYNEKMKEGWDDPDLFGGLEFTQPVVDLRWTGPRSARLEVPGRRHSVTLREQVGDVKVKWVFGVRYREPKGSVKVLEPVGAKTPKNSP